MCAVSRLLSILLCLFVGSIEHMSGSELSLVSFRYSVSLFDSCCEYDLCLSVRSTLAYMIHNFDM